MKDDCLISIVSPVYQAEGNISELVRQITASVSQITGKFEIILVEDGSADSTNRKAFFNGEVDKYTWADIGSSFLPSEIIAAFLFAQLERIDAIQTKRKQVWNYYFTGLSGLEREGKIRLPFIPHYASNNAHMFYIICQSQSEREALIVHIREANINAVFHYLSLHKSLFYAEKHDGRKLPMSDHYSECLLRLPFFYELTEKEKDCVVDSIKLFYSKK